MSSKIALDSPDLYTVGWISALPIERAAAVSMLDEEHAQPTGFHRNANDKNVYTWGRMGEHNIVIASLPVGSYGIVSAAGTAAELLSSLPSIRVGLMVGIGGGIARPDEGRDIRLGDVVVSQPQGTHGGVFQYDLIKAKSGNSREAKGHLAAPPIVLLNALAAIQASHELEDSKVPEILEGSFKKYPRMAKKFKNNPGYGFQGIENDRLFPSTLEHSGGRDCSECDPAQAVDRDERDAQAPEIHYGIIASGNMLVKDATLRDRIANDAGEDCICIEMEAAGLMNRFPCLVIRGICDYADTHKNDRWQRYASATAAAYAKEFLAFVPAADIEETKRASEILQNIEASVGQAQQDISTLVSDAHFRDIKNWLSAPDPSTNLNDARKEAQEGTGAWLFNSAEYCGWKSHPDSRLLLLGLSGCGKTILASKIINSLLLTEQDSHITLFFFFDFRDGKKETVDQLLRSLVFQLYTKVGSCRAALDTAFNSSKPGSAPPSADEIPKILRHMFKACESKIFIVLDALDECTTRKDLIDWLEDVLAESTTSISIAATGRPEAEFENRFLKWEKQDLSTSSAADIRGDIQSFVEQRLRDRAFERWRSRPDVLKRMKSVVLDKAGQMFRLAACQVDLLEDCQGLQEVQERLETLPGTLADIYSRILEKIPEGRRRERTIRLLQLLCYSRRPVDLNEAIDYVAIDIDSGRFGPDNKLPEPWELRTSCGGLVVISTEENFYGLAYLQLAHLSVKEYLTSGSASCEQFALENANGYIARHCLAYLFTINGLTTSKLPFAQYARRFWGDHARLAEGLPEVCDVVWRLIHDSTVLRHWYSTEDAVFVFPGHPIMDLSRNPLAFAAFWGLEKTCKALLRRKKADKVHKQDADLHTALQAASGRGHISVVEYLLAEGADPDAEGELYPSALSHACHCGQARVVHLLLKRGADLDRGHGSALQAAAVVGDTSIVKLLLERGADVNLQGGPYGNALQAALAFGHIGAVKLLLERGADVNLQGGPYGSALRAAYILDHEGNVKLLLERGADMNFKRGPYGNALQTASAGGHTEIIELLLERGADVNFQGGFYGNALQAAAAFGRAGTVELLLERGADVNLQGGRYSSALQAALAKGHTGIVKLLLASGATMADGGDEANKGD